LSGPSCLAVGGHLKTSIAVTRDNEAIISPHIGDLDTLETIRSYARTIQDMKRLHDIEPEMVVCDRHPDYRSVHYATRHNQTPVSVQHHHAHILACMAEHQLEEPVLGVAWDGSGYGGDGTVWGGEFLLVRGDSFTHIARMRRFHLPGGEAATREPRRSALGVLYELYGEEAVMQDLPPVKACSPNELEMFIGMMRGNAHAPLTSSVGRLFDAVASLLNLRQITGFEGEAAMALEYAIVGQDDSSGYPVELHDADGEPIMLDWKPMMIRLIEDIHRNVDRGCIARRFHDALAFGVVSVAGRVGMKNVALSGGCFQNLYLIERAIRVLRERGFEPYWPRRIPPNDGGLSLGQAVFALMKSKTEG
jgi:hydrogenase maturation protein HypF